MSKLQIVKVEPLNLPSNIVWRITGRYHIELKNFYVYASESESKMYVKNGVPEEDVAEFVRIATYPGRYVTDDDTEIGQTMNYIYEKYGYAAYSTLREYHEWMQEQQDEQRAKERVRSAIPSIEKMIAAGMIDEYMLHEAYRAGSDRKGRTAKNICSFYTVYPYCLGYLMGSGALKEDYSPQDSGNVVDFYYKISEMLEHIDIEEMPRIYGYLKEMYFTE